MNGQTGPHEDMLERATAALRDMPVPVGPSDDVASAVADAAAAVKRVSQYVAQRRGGDGAVAEVIELVLCKQGRWSRDLYL